MSIPNQPVVKPDYRRLSIGAKQALHRDRMREPAVVCPVCETQTTATDLLEHRASRCPGKREPSAGSKWVSWREALALGVPARTLANWAASGWVRVRGDRMDRLYLLRDLAQRIARRKHRRVGAKNGSADAATPARDQKKPLILSAGQDPEDHMNKADAYKVVQDEIKTARTAKTPADAAAACHRAKLALAEVAAGEDWDPRRHRAIAGTLRDLGRAGRPGRGKAGTVGA
jgi:hypothetical protein